MVYTINIIYDRAWHVPSNTLNPTIAVIPAHLIALRGWSLTGLINEIFSEDFKTVFTKNEHLIHNSPSEVILIDSRLTREQVVRLDMMYIDEPDRVKSIFLCR
ncbi:MAG: hypothetical protein DI617_08410 [Streptococcus pyogenes]|nr:MAG: hypothetical protein DI617_08410 [Streptococcus pyogenes]